MILSTNLIEYCELFLKLLKIRSIESSNASTLWDIIDEQFDTERLLEAMDKVWKLLNLEEIDFCENFAKIIKNNSTIIFEINKLKSIQTVSSLELGPKEKAICKNF